MNGLADSFRCLCAAIALRFVWQVYRFTQSRFVKRQDVTSVIKVRVCKGEYFPNGSSVLFFLCIFQASRIT